MLRGGFGARPLQIEFPPVVPARAGRGQKLVVRLSKAEGFEKALLIARMRPHQGLFRCCRAQSAEDAGQCRRAAAMHAEAEDALPDRHEAKLLAWKGKSRAAVSVARDRRSAKPLF